MSSSVEERLEAIEQQRMDDDGCPNPPMLDGYSAYDIKLLYRVQDESFSHYPTDVYYDRLEQVIVVNPPKRNLWQRIRWLLSTAAGNLF